MATGGDQYLVVLRQPTGIGALAASASLSVKIVDDACRSTGTAAVAHDHILGRCRRDAHALEGHIATNGASAEHNSRVSLGLSADHILV